MTPQNTFADSGADLELSGISLGGPDAAMGTTEVEIEDNIIEAQALAARFNTLRRLGHA